MKRKSTGPLVCLLSLFSVGACASEESLKSGSQVSSFETVTAAIGVTEKKLTGFYHFKQMEMPGRSFHTDCKIFFSGDFSAGNVFAVRATAADSKSMTPVNGTLTFKVSIKPAKGLPAEQSFTLVLAETIPNCTDNIGVNRPPEKATQAFSNINCAGLRNLLSYKDAQVTTVWRPSQMR